ncbi:MAG: secretin and TonB N-terminal domain-containing protein, partial [Azoarcus sp.]|nr:secretin and TonB N-terminal domain-containing protein [Azoarcus sp.]
MKKKTTMKWVLAAALSGLLLGGASTAAQTPALAQPASVTNLNRIDSLKVADDAGILYVRVSMQSPLTATPASFTVANPPRIAFDFPATSNGLGQSIQSIERGDLRSVNVVQVGDRTRLVLNMSKLLAYETSADGNTLTIALSPSTVAAAPAKTATAAKSATVPPSAAPAQAKGAVSATASVKASQLALGQSINDINFRRGERGEGRIVVQLSSSDIGIDVRQQGGKLLVNFLKTKLPENLNRRSDVTDFGTPVSNMVAEQQGENTRLTVTPTGMWEHNAYQSNDQFILEIKRMTEDPNRLVQRGGGRTKYAGDKLSLNFQNVDVRSVLQVIADFTDFNIVTSDTVQGSITLRLKDVPWDQALDIILQAKGLDMRRNGNVIWIAPGDELAAREKMINEARAQIEELEPVQTE